MEIDSFYMFKADENFIIDGTKKEILQDSSTTVSMQVLVKSHTSEEFLLSLLVVMTPVVTHLISIRRVWYPFSLA